MHLLHVLDTFALFVTSVHAPYIYVNLMFSIHKKRPKLQKQFPKVAAGNNLPLQHAEILIPLEQIPRVHLFPHIIQAAVIPVGNNRLALLLKPLQIIHNPASEKRASIL